MLPLSLILNLVFAGYSSVVLPIILVHLISKASRSFIQRIVEISNSILLGAATVFLLLLLFQGLAYVLFQQEYDFIIPSQWLFGRYALTQWSILVVKGLIPQLLWDRRIRKNIWSSLFIFPFLLFDHYYLFIVKLVTNMHRDYLPNSPVIYFPNLFEILLPLFIYVCLIALGYWVSKRIHGAKYNHGDK